MQALAAKSQEFFAARQPLDDIPAWGKKHRQEQSTVTVPKEGQVCYEQGLE